MSHRRSGPKRRHEPTGAHVWVRHGPSSGKIHLAKLAAVFGRNALSVQALCGVEALIHRIVLIEDADAETGADICQRCRCSLLMRAPVVWEATPARVRRELALRALGDM